MSVLNSRNKGVRLAAMLLTMCLFAGAALAADQDVKEKREEARKSAQETLTMLYKVQPSAKAAIESAAGYAAFEDFGVKIFVAGGGGGSGMAVNNKTKKETFMKMLEVQAGLGLGVKQYRVVFLFETEKALETFIHQGWDLSGQAAVAAKAGDIGAGLQGALSVAPGVWLYELTENGLAAELTVKGTKYFKDDKLN